MAYLLDTNIISDLVRNPQGKIAEKISRVGEKSICTSIIVAAELRYGAKKRGSAKLTRQVEAILSALDVLPIDEPVDYLYAKVRTALEKRGAAIGPNDLLIASHALSLGMVVVTANRNKFSRVPGLKS